MRTRARSRRFIPACAGNSLDWGGRAPIQPVHPRVCGEQALDCHAARRSAGSSPRVRGTGSAHMLRQQGSRFIPACAGNRGFMASVGAAIPVHPRVCGEQFIQSVLAEGGSGSSPRVRGTVFICLSRTARRRFIPACAGNSPAINSASVPLSVHPRVCGEQRFSRSPRRLHRGSSPRVRGTA